MEKAQTHYRHALFHVDLTPLLWEWYLFTLFSFLELLPSIFCTHAPNIGKKEAWQST